MPTTWQELAAEKKARQAASIPKEWLIVPPSEDILDVTDIPAKCGLLSARDLEITEVTSVAALLSKIATGAWTSVEVTTAFCKRAIIAHQVVRASSSPTHQIHVARCYHIDKLSHGNLHRPGPREGCMARRATEIYRESCWSPPRSSSLSQGPDSHKRLGDNNGCVTRVDMVKFASDTLHFRICLLDRASSRTRCCTHRDLDRMWCRSVRSYQRTTNTHGVASRGWCKQYLILFLVARVLQPCFREDCQPRQSLLD
jgi:hypothetical protein